jgi:SAM-dependent methyltransferase
VIPNMVATEPARRPALRVADIFNSTVAGFAVAAAWELGALDELRDRGILSCETFSAERGLDLASTQSMFAALASVDLVSRTGSVIRPGQHFTELYRDKAFFHWLTVGCAELFANMARVTRADARVGAYYRRDAAAIGYACRDINQLSFDPAFWQGVEALDFGVTVVADLGCGSGGRLVQIAERYPKARGLGIDIAPATLRAAREHAHAVGVSDRVDFVEGDVCNLGSDVRFAEVELLTSFMMGHDFWPRDSCITVLNRLRSAFPNVRRFLLGDTARTRGVADRDQQVFSLAFETAHDLMGDYLPTLDEWMDLFPETDWKCLNVRHIERPTDSFIFELT